VLEFYEKTLMVWFSTYFRIFIADESHILLTFWHQSFIFNSNKSPT